MRVLQIGPYPPPHGGVQSNLVAIRRYLRAQAIPCAVINITRHRQRDQDDVYYPSSALEVVALLLKLPYDVAHIHFGGRLNFELLGLVLTCSLLPRARTVLTVHSGGFPDSPEGRRARRFSLPGFVFRRLDRVIVVNRALLGVLRRFGVHQERLRLIDPYSFAAGDIAAEGPPEIERFAGAHTPLLTTVGLLEPEYDLELQIRVLGDVRRRFPDAGLLIVGSGSVEPALRKRIAADAHAPHILLAGDVPHAAVLRAIRGSAAFLRTTLYDGDSVSVREALQLGVPVIATDNGLRPAGVTLIPIGDRDALLAAVLRIAGNERLAPASPVATDDNLKAVLDLYRELVR